MLASIWCIGCTRKRGSGLEEAATTQEESGTAPGRAFRKKRTKSSIEHRFCGRSIAGWDTLPGVDGRRCIHTRERRDRGRSETQRRRCSTGIKPAETTTWGAEGLVLRQRQRVHQSSHGPVGLPEWNEDRLLPPRQAERQCLRGIVQRNLPSRVPKCSLVRDAERSKTADRSIAAGIQ